MTAQSLHALSGGRCLLGIGTSGPQVMEGWHGVSFDKPVRRTRETIEIIRAITAGERLDYHGQIYQLPLPGSEGRAIRSLDVTDAPADLPRLARPGQPPPHRRDRRRMDRHLVLPGDRGGVPRPRSAKERRLQDGSSPTSTSPSPLVSSSPTTSRPPAAAMPTATRSPSVPWARPARTSTTTRLSVRATATTYARSNGSGSRATEDAARRRVPTAIGLGTNLIGTDDLVRDRLRLYRDAGITTLRANLHGGTDADLDRQLGDLERLLDLMRQVNDETTAADIG